MTLTATGPGGADGETKIGYIVVSEPAPVADFSGDVLTGVAPLSVNFSDLSTGAVTSWAWSFGDGNTSTLQTPSNAYAAAGTYDVTLTATGPGGADGETKIGYIVVTEPAPVAEFSADVLTGAAPLSVNFSDLSTGAVTSWAWDFGDGNTSTLQNPANAYAAAGTFDVTLTVTGPGGVDAEIKVGYIVVTP
ncbi:MAG: PKD repeat protein [Gammaproteobacteria bacterium]